MKVLTPAAAAHLPTVTGIVKIAVIAVGGEEVKVEAEDEETTTQTIINLATKINSTRKEKTSVAKGKYYKHANERGSILEKLFIKPNYLKK